MKRREVKEFVSGALAVIVLALILTLLNTRDRFAVSGASSDFTIFATFNRVDGLNVGAPVMMSGLDVGVVQRVDLDEHYRVRMTMRVDSGVEIPIDTGAAVHTDGLFGSKFVSLDPGGDEEVLGDGGVVTFTQDAVIVSELMDLIIAEGKAKRPLSKSEQ